MSKDPIPDIMSSDDIEMEPHDSVKFVLYVNNKLVIDVGSTLSASTSLSTVLENIARILKDPDKKMLSEGLKDAVFKDINTGDIIDKAENLKKMGSKDKDEGA